MKKLNKKGFTLAELLIVIAIIAILIAIAIPAFGSALDNARLQTDHANMRSAYAIAQVANMQGYIEIDGDVYKANPDTGAGEKDLKTLSGAYFGADGNVTTATTKAYVTLVKPATTKCTASAFCTSGAKNGVAIPHDKNKLITYSYDATDGIVLSLTDAS